MTERDFRCAPAIRRRATQYTGNRVRLPLQGLVGSLIAKAMAASMGVYRVASTGRSAAVLLRARTAFGSIGSDKLRECGTLEKFSQEFQIDSAPRNAEIAGDLTGDVIVVFTITQKPLRECR